MNIYCRWFAWVGLHRISLKLDYCKQFCQLGCFKSAIFRYRFYHAWLARNLKSWFLLSHSALFYTQLRQFVYKYLLYLFVFLIVTIHRGTILLFRCQKRNSKLLNNSQYMLILKVFPGGRKERPDTKNHHSSNQEINRKRLYSEHVNSAVSCARIDITRVPDLLLMPLAKCYECLFKLVDENCSIRCSY